MKEERLIHFVNTVLINNLTSIYLSINSDADSVWMVSLLDPVLSDSNCMDIGKDESDTNDTHSCTKAVIRFPL